MNDIIVAKFGGSSLASAEQFKKVKNIIMKDSRRRYIIPSAPGKRNDKDYKITDLLYLCHAHVQNKISFDDVFKIIEDRYKEIVNDLGLSVDIEFYLSKMKKIISDGGSCDYTVSRGEYLNGIILANFLDYEFVDASQVICFDKYGCFDSKRTQISAKDKLKNIKNAVIPGFYGSMPDGSIKTFSRGGSDITGAIIAKDVEASLYENWTDVSGFLMADPRIVENPKPIEKITYNELRELAYMGASVLHEEAIFPAKEGNIPINIKNTNCPHDKGTIIVNEIDLKDGGRKITGIAGRKDFTVIAVQKTYMNAEIGFGRRLLSALETYGISFEHMPSGIDTISIVIEDSQLDNKLDKLLEEIKRQCNPDSIHVIPNMALIATVGMGMAKAVGTSEKIFSALAKSHINIGMIDQGSSEINIIIGVDSNDFEKAIKAIYKAFE
ncbi:aspartate kinase [Clostridium botulinum]|uniref:Aspartokinase n=1 Tax=Clostridium botulinum TaxID=1491 RepID=A0A9Q1UWV3_CLOBO|nr:aspartate kinase [Clostridium botulinum]AEB76608.1 aspartate kinase [Clostridium botulinum BKT015925]KEI02965.1 aspartate kinase [Clostridium botulinum C/D str. Sp77]KEI04015.1 aspartate kinase [Clostridium botulinum D str. 16868]KLU76516.1 aspartate kinase [Clostridium botulinum V891]KOA76999.1 aspartate kinase [Clostridium botulinum]